MALGKKEMISIPKVLALSTSAYSTGFQLGTLLTLSNACPDAGFGVIVEAVAIADKSGNNAPIDLFIFGNQPIITSTDRTAADITDANLFGLRPIVVPVTAYATLKNNSIAYLNGIGANLTPSSGVDIYCLPVIRGTATYAASDLEITFHLIQDRS